MRHNVTLLLLLPLLALTGCGGGSPDNGQPGTESWARNQIGNQGSPNFRRPDGSFDRADYRRVMVPGCAAGLRDGNPSTPAAEVDRFCTCFVDHVLAGSSDPELFAIRPDSELERRKYGAATAACRPAAASAGPGRDSDAEAPPPPEEPVPSLNDSLPPPVAAPPPRR